MQSPKKINKKFSKGNNMFERSAQAVDLESSDLLATQRSKHSLLPFFLEV